MNKAAAKQTQEDLGRERKTRIAERLQLERQLTEAIIALTRWVIDNLDLNETEREYVDKTFFELSILARKNYWACHDLSPMYKPKDIQRKMDCLWKITEKNLKKSGTSERRIKLLGDLAQFAHPRHFTIGTSPGDVPNGDYASAEFLRQLATQRFLPRLLKLALDISIK